MVSQRRFAQLRYPSLPARPSYGFDVTHVHLLQRIPDPFRVNFQNLSFSFEFKNDFGGIRIEFWDIRNVVWCIIIDFWGWVCVFWCFPVGFGQKWRTLPKMVWPEMVGEGWVTPDSAVGLPWPSRWVSRHRWVLMGFSFRRKRVLLRLLFLSLWPLPLLLFYLVVI